MTLLALSPAPPPAVSSTPGATATPESAAGFGVVMSDATTARAAADASVSTGPGAPEARVAPSNLPAPSAATDTSDSAAEPASPRGTDQPAYAILAPVALPVALPVVLPVAPPVALPGALPGALSTVPTTATPVTDASADPPSSLPVGQIAASAGPFAAAAVSPTSVPREAVASIARPVRLTGPTGDASTEPPSALSATVTPSATPPTLTPAAGTVPALNSAVDSAATPSAPIPAAELTAARPKPDFSPVTDAAVPQPIAAPTRLESAPAPIVAATPAPPPSTPLTAQLTRPIFTLTTAAPGTHTMTISVTPDDLGPVTVRAQVTPAGIRVELFAPTDIGRDAIRAILPELRKDLAGGGLGATLDLSSQNQPSDAGDRRRDAGTPRERAYVVPAGIVADAPRDALRSLGTSSIDVLA
ncbi:MAG: flagellar hook-length control protein FliK [Actinomycetota bacterium]